MLAWPHHERGDAGHRGIDHRTSPVYRFAVMDYAAWVERAAQAVEALAALMIFAFVVVATLAWLVRSVAARETLISSYESYRRRLGRSLLVGLEILVAADIIRTMLDSSLRSLAGLGLVVLIRTFLSWSITLEIEGRWPWEAPLGRKAE